MLNARSCTLGMLMTWSQVPSRIPLFLQTSVSGRAPGNTAAIQQNLAVCGSQVYVIDKASTRACFVACRCS